jgi:CTP:molybdopterin cytidylyltransferase MocA
LLKRLFAVLDAHYSLSSAPHQRLFALVLAAGQSSRMGAFKPLLELNGRPVIVNTVASALAGGASHVVVVVGKRAHEVQAVLTAAFGERVSFAINPDYATSDMLHSVQVGCQALEALAAAGFPPPGAPKVTQNSCDPAGFSVEAIHNACDPALLFAQNAARPGACDAFYLLPGDMPVVNPATFAALACVREQTGALVCFPQLNGYRKHPPLIAAALIPRILAYHGPQGLRGLWEELSYGMTCVNVDDPGVWVDLDTQQDFVRCKQTFEYVGRM